MNVLFWGRCDFPISFSGRDMSRNVWNRLLGSSMVDTEILSNNMRPLSRLLHNILEDDHIQWHPPWVRHYINFWPCYWSGPYCRIWLFNLVARSFHRTFAWGMACQQRTLTPPNTWSCPVLGLAGVRMLRPISLELVLFPDFRISSVILFYLQYL